ncbi:hypothetical protein D3C76_678970 [compost metagenome]
MIDGRPYEFNLAITFKQLTPYGFRECIDRPTKILFNWILIMYNKMRMRIKRLRTLINFRP